MLDKEIYAEPSFPFDINLPCNNIPKLKADTFCNHNENNNKSIFESKIQGHQELFTQANKII